MFIDYITPQERLPQTFIEKVAVWIKNNIDKSTPMYNLKVDNCCEGYQELPDALKAGYTVTCSCPMKKKLTSLRKRLVLKKMKEVIYKLHQDAQIREIA